MIGIFDSGIGGLTVAKQVIKRLPNCSLTYFGDTARLPYGTKGPEFVKKYSEKITEWLIQKNAKAIVIACHTSSAWAGDYLRKKFNIPIFDVLSSSVDKINFKKIGIIGTPGTIKSGAWERGILERNPSAKIYSKACPLFVPLAEEGIVSGIIAEKTAENYLKGLAKVDALVLACTHYPLLARVIRKTVGRQVKIIDPGVILAKDIEGAFVEREEKPSISIFFSDVPYNFGKISKSLKMESEITVKDPFYE